MPVSKLEAQQVFDFCVNNLVNKNLHVGLFIYKLNPGWTLKFVRSKKFAGCCDFKTNEIKLSSIYLKSLIVTINDVIETLLHELAHAIAGYINGHNIIWKHIAQLIGSNGKVFCEKIFSPYKYQLCCPEGCKQFRHQINRKTYIENMVTCPKHKHLPLMIVNLEDNSVLKTYKNELELKILQQHFIINTDGVNPRAIPL